MKGNPFASGPQILNRPEIEMKSIEYVMEGS